MGRGGDDEEEGLGRLYRTHAPAAVRFGALLTGSRTRGEDLAHDAFLDAVGRLGSLRDPAAFGAYLRTCVARRHLMERRSRGRASAREARISPRELRAGDTDAVGDGLVLVDALRRLTPSQRVAVIMRYWHDLPEAEIARVLGCRPGTVKSTLSRALETLRQEVPADDVDV